MSPALPTSRLTHLMALVCETRADLIGVAMTEGREVVAEEVQEVRMLERGRYGGKSEDCS
jgi:hypothetical protein